MKHIAISTLLSAFSYFAIAQSPRTVLLETSESVWTATNSTVICAKERAKSDHGTNLATISHHWDDLQNGGDPLYQSFSNQWAQSFFVTQWGRGGIDRVAYNGNTSNSMVSLSPNEWNDTIAARLNRTTDALVTLPEVLYDPNVDEIFVRAQVQFTIGSIENREMRFFLYVVQDAVQAAQVVDTAELGTCTLFPTLSNDTAYNYYHNDVAILNPSTYEGTDNIIPLQVAEDSKYSSIYTFSKPSGVNLADMKIVAFVANYSNADVRLNRVINTAQKFSFTTYDKSDESDPNHPDNPNNPNSLMHPSNWPTGVEQFELNKSGVEIFPNPVKDVALIRFHVPSKQYVHVTMYDIEGRLVKSIYHQPLAAGNQQAAVATHSLPNGNYLVRIQGQTFVEQARIVVLSQ